MNLLSPAPRFQAIDDNGDPVAGGLLYTYAAGTSTPIATYTTQAGTVANANPIVLDTSGRAAIYITEGTGYKFVLKDSLGATIYTQDNILIPARYTGISIGDPISGGTLQSVLFVGTGSVTLQQDPLNLVWDNSNNRLGIALFGVAPTQTLHVDGNVRIDSTLLHAVNLFFGNTLSDTNGGLIQYADSQIVGGQGLMLTGVGHTNATVGVGTDNFLINTGCHIAFASGNIQASQGELLALRAGTGVPDNGDGNNSDYYFRSDGTSSTSFYKKIAGAWTAIGGGGGSGMVIGDAVTGGTNKSVLFVGAGPVLAQDNTNFYWDNTGKMLWIGGGTGIYGDASFNIFITDIQAPSGLVGAGAGTVVAIGSGVMNALVNGYDVAAVGTQAGATLTSGNEGTFIGPYADGTATGNNQNSFGFQATCTADDQVTLGNSGIATLRCQQTSITALSDKRDKTNIKDLALGLDFINDIRSVSYYWLHDRESGLPRPGQEAGFLAQELQAASEKHGAEWLRLVDATNPDRLEATPGRLLPVIVRAIQELSAKVDAQKA